MEEEIKKAPNDKKTIKEKVAPTRKEIILESAVIIVSFLFVCVTIFSIFLYRAYSRNNNVITPTPTTSSTPISDGLSKIEGTFRDKYIYDLDEEEIRDDVIRAFIKSTNDKYAYYYTSEEWTELLTKESGTSSGIGIIVSFNADDFSLIVCKVMKDSPADKAGIKPLDKIVGVDGISFEGLEYSSILEKTRGKKGSTSTFVINRDGETINLEITRDDYNYETVSSYIKEVDGEKISVIKIDEFYDKTFEEFQKAVQEGLDNNVKGFIFDVRSNPGGLLNSITSILDYLLGEGPIVKIEYKNATEQMVINSDAEYITDLPFVVLTNNNTASAAELFTSCLKDNNRATIVGEKTYGKGCGQTTFLLSGGRAFKLTTFLYYPPTSGNYDGVGINPDYEIILSDEAKKKNIYLLTDEEDIQLRKGIEIIMGE